MKSSVRFQFDIVLSLLTVAFIIITDRLSKIYFAKFLSEGESLPIIRNVLHMTLVHNTGIAFGLFKDHGIIFIIIPIVFVILLVINIYYYKKTQSLSLPYILGFSLIIGGAVGNLVDRITLGYVIDFVDIRIWPVFNIADSAITIGAVIILLQCIPLSAK